MKNNIPLDVAFSLPDEMSAAMAITFSRFEGAKFNTDTMTFEKPD